MSDQRTEIAVGAIKGLLALAALGILGAPLAIGLFRALLEIWSYVLS